MQRYIERSWREHLSLIRELEPLFSRIEVLASKMKGVFDGGGKVLIFGNGGSAASSQHFAAELVGRFTKGDNLQLPALALTVDTSLITALANDFGYDEIFAKQVSALGCRGDMALGITTSGKSPNVVKALELAGERGLTTVGLTGGEGLPCQVDLEIKVPSHDTPRTQEAHDFILHTIAGVIKLLR